MSIETHPTGPCTNCWGGTKLVDGKRVSVDPRCKGRGSPRPQPRPRVIPGAMGATEDAT